jgi:hypothetical protein
MKKTVVLASLLACSTIVAAVVTIPIYQRGRLTARLNGSQSPQATANAMKEYVDSGYASGDKTLVDFARRDRTVAFDPMHSVAVVVDESDGTVFLVTPSFRYDRDGFKGTADVRNSLRVGVDPPRLFQEVQQLWSNEKESSFLHKQSRPTPNSDEGYHRLAFLFEEGQPAGTASFDVGQGEIDRWKSNGLWPY